MPQTNVNFRMDSDLKRDMEKTCKELGLNMTTAFTIFAKKMIREKRIPFEVSVDPFYSEENQKWLREAFDALDNGKGSEHDLIEVDDD
ncbi:MAG: type II toxin-antitoxin system RelB/DinJ family antitoxin [Oscillospiraceae bacterium]|nr:type II toxin-antitoxin system RelB/DinJ family antitoxin [Oscillospiraceae bacterium]